MLKIILHDGHFYEGEIIEVETYDNYVLIHVKRNKKHFHPDVIELAIPQSKRTEFLELLYEMLNDPVAFVDTQGLYDALEEI